MTSTAVTRESGRPGTPSHDLATDVALIKAALGDELESVALFGSSISKGVGSGRDIDIALFTRTTDAAAVRLIITAIPLRHPISSTQVRQDYGGGGGRVPGRPYDVLVLRPGRSREAFIARHSGQLRYL
jgi:hypothetical protein